MVFPPTWNLLFRHPAGALKYQKSGNNILPVTGECPQGKNYTRRYTGEKSPNLEYWNVSVFSVGLKKRSDLQVFPCTGEKVFWNFHSPS